MSNLPDTWTAFAEVKSLGGRPHMQKIKGKETGKLILPVSIAENGKYINRASESLGGGCHLPSLGDEYSGMSTIAMSRRDRNKITRRFAQIEREEKARYKGTRTGYSVKIPIPNGLSIEQGIELGDRICNLVLGDRHEYAFSLHRGEIPKEYRREMEAKERDPLTGKMRFTARARAIRRVIRTEDNRHLHVTFKELPLGRKDKKTVRWMQEKKHGVMLLRRHPLEPDGTRARHGFDDALEEILSQKYGIKPGASTPETRRPRISQEVFKVRQKEAILAAEIEENQHDLDEIIAAMREDQVQWEETKQSYDDQIRALEKGLDPSGKRPRSPRSDRPLDPAVQAQLDRINQRSQARIREAEKYRSGQDKNDRSRTRVDNTREPGRDRGGIDR